MLNSLVCTLKGRNKSHKETLNLDLATLPPPSAGGQGDLAGLPWSKFNANHYMTLAVIHNGGIVPINFKTKMTRAAVAALLAGN